jgi:hypothetical protein
MSDLSFVRFFRLRAGGVECDANGLRVGGVALLARGAKGDWRRRDEGDLNRQLSKRYGFPLDLGRKRGGIDAVAGALNNGELARAQVAALLLQLPDPPSSADAEPDGLEKRRRLAYELADGDLLKADADWDDKHPRAGAPPNPGWFAPTSAESGTDGPKTGPSRAAGETSRGGAERAFLRPAPAAGVGSLLAENLPAITLRGLVTLAARVSVPTILFGAIFIPSDNRLVEESRIPGRPDVAYRWAHDETATAVTLKVLVDGQWRTLAVGSAAPNGFFVYDSGGHAVARVVGGPDRRQTLVATNSALDRAVAELRRKDGEPVAAPIANDNEPKLCPDPMKEPKTTKSANSIAYQEYVSGLPYGWAIFIGTVRFDGCAPETGFLKEAKANNEHLFDANDDLNGWVYPENDPVIQMRRQSDAAAAVGRVVFWRVQIERVYRGLKKIADDNHFPNLFVEYDPN